MPAHRDGVRLSIPGARCVSYEEALEQQIDLWTRWRTAYGYVGRAVSTLQYADTYWLGREVAELVYAGYSTLPGTVRLMPDVLPSAHGFLSLDRPIRITVND